MSTPRRPLLPRGALSTRRRRRGATIRIVLVSTRQLGAAVNMVQRASRASTDPARAPLCASG
eukprot:1550565-Alexandrium_andersonii.AAC.1